jgi:hypothetical protein
MRPLGAGPESIIPAVGMDSGLATSSRPGMTAYFLLGDDGGVDQIHPNDRLLALRLAVFLV